MTAASLAERLETARDRVASFAAAIVDVPGLQEALNNWMDTSEAVAQEALACAQAAEVERVKLEGEHQDFRLQNDAEWRSQAEQIVVALSSREREGVQP